MALKFSFDKTEICITFILGMIVQNGFAKTNVYGNLMMYLTLNNDIDIESVLFIDGDQEKTEIDDLFDYVTMEEKDLHFESFYPFSYLRNAFDHSIQRLMNALSRSEKATLVFVNHVASDGDSKEILEYLTEDLLQKHIWLFLHPLANLTESTLRKQMISNQLDANPNLRLNSQVISSKYILKLFLSITNILHQLLKRPSNVKGRLLCYMLTMLGTVLEFAYKVQSHLRIQEY